MWNLNTTIANRADRRTLLEAAPKQFRIPVDTCTCAHYCVFAKTPGKTQRRRKVIVVVFCRGEITPIERSQISRLIQIAIDEGALKVPRKPIVQSKVRLQSPRVLTEKAVAAVHLRFFDIIRRRLRRISYTYHCSGKRKIQEVLFSLDSGRQ